jgi:diguanylate cyclase (GGDEF)-like protein
VGADITALKHSEKSLRQAHEAALQAARTDPLTGLPNRRRILELFDEALKEVHRIGAGLCIALIDIDRFKAINDTYGHEAGDAVLQHFAHVCGEGLRAQHHLGRMGGEEFLMLLPGAGLNEAVGLVEQLRADFPPARFKESGVELPYTFCAGIAEVLPHEDRSAVLRRADRAPYCAKREGRSCTKAASP